MDELQWALTPSDKQNKKKKTKNLSRQKALKQRTAWATTPYVQMFADYSAHSVAIGGLNLGATGSPLNSQIRQTKADLLPEAARVQ